MTISLLGEYTTTTESTIALYLPKSRKWSQLWSRDTVWVDLIKSYPASAAGVGIKGGVGGECESCTVCAIGSHMAAPITLKLSGIDRGNSVSVLVRVRGRMIQDS